MFATVENEISSLGHIPYKSGVQNLKFALTAQNDLKIGYILEARNKFIEACSIEINENLILAHLGLALCQKMLGDELNSQVTLKNARNICYSCASSITPNEKKQLFISNLNAIPIALMIGGHNIATPMVMNLVTKSESWWIDEYNKLHRKRFEDFKASIFNQEHSVKDLSI